MFILFDIGGTKTRIARSRDCKSFDEPIKIDTPKSFAEGLLTFGRIARELCGSERVRYAGGGIAGLLDNEQAALKSSNIKGWIGKPLKQELSKVFGAPVILKNDADVVGLGEVHHGAGKKGNIVVYITVSTGVGGVRIVDGYIDKGRLGFEPGHQIIDMGGAACPQCNTTNAHTTKGGQLEDYISGTSVERRFKRKPFEIEQSDPLWRGLAHALAVGLNNSILHWAPDTIVLGGSMIVGDPAIPMDMITQELQQTFTIPALLPNLPILKKAELEDVGGLYGSMVLLEQNKEG